MHAVTNISLLDLRAVEARLEAGGAASREEEKVLLAHCRALRAALEPLALSVYQLRDDQESLGGLVHGDDIRRAASVLAQAVDEA